MITDTKASIRFFTLEPRVDFISSALSVLPHRTHLIGEPVSSRNPTGPKRPDSVWIYESGLPDSASLDEHLGALCSVLSRGAEQLEAIKGRLDSYDIFCFLSSDTGQGGCCISPHHLKFLGDAGFEVIFDLYLSS